ncbi:HEPN domain-containing protein [Pseudomonas donghuensis]|uniref:HEPN domain-containing protein n=1 Tax=Pseudomonas donghuensis TaxID=1163398 RepID=UPI00215FC4F1|nr:HEPN domain-containing protein [Pseudomonas donghuensis]UVL23723.1 hypothetical protein LOY30_23385 [Pseudomonas donghuensis]
MASKELRQAQTELQVLLKSKHLMTEMQAFKSFDFMERLRREVRTPNGSKVSFTDRAVKSFECLISITAGTLPSKGLVESGDIAQAYKSVLGRWYEEGVPGDVSLFLDEVELVLTQSIRVHEFYSALSGLDLKGFDDFKLGSVVVQKPCRELVESCVAQDAVADLTWRETSYGLWLSTQIKGSSSCAERRFFELAKLTCGLLAIAFTLGLGRGGAVVRFIPGLEGRYKPGAITWFSVEATTRELNLKTSFDGVQRLELTQEFASFLQDSDWFPELVRISQLDAGNDAEQALRRALYWYFDAQADTSLEMKFIKYWSCIECMFSVGLTKVTQRIKKGVTGLLCYGGYQYSKPEDLQSLAVRVGKLYQLRCDAVHDAKHDHVGFHDVVDVSKWAAVVVIEVSMMISLGMDKRTQLKEQIDRFHEYHAATKFKATYRHFESRFSGR